MRSVRYLGLLLVAVALIVAGCGGGEGGGGGGSSSGPTEPTLLEPGKVTNGKLIVDIREAKYVPDKVTIPEGTQVTWTNSDDVDHSVTKESGPGPDFDSGPIAPGATFSQVFKRTGTIKIKDTQTKGGQGPSMTLIVESKSKSQPAPGGNEQPPTTPTPGQSNQQPGGGQ
jgi:plastocyanin